MSHISEHIFKLYNQLSEDEIQPIDDDVVVNAINIINRISVNNSDSLFYFLTAMNLLNAAINNSSLKFEIMAKQLYVASQRVL
jgi:hypothetical protein